MGIQINDDRMWVEGHEHLRAVACDAGWHVSWWLHFVDRNQAITAMVLASTVTAGVTAGDRQWAHVQTWAGELGLTATEAHRMISQANERAAQAATDEAAGVDL